MTNHLRLVSGDGAAPTGVRLDDSLGLISHQDIGHIAVTDIDGITINRTKTGISPFTPILKTPTYSRNSGKNLTVVGAVSPGAGLVAWRTLDGGMDGAAFLSFVTEALIPALVAGQTVVMDNLSSYKTKAVRAAFTEAGVHVLYLPRYSPEWNPIELCWATVTRRLRRIAARTRERLREAVAEALGRVTAAQVHRWVRHCGYRLTGNSI